MLNAEKNLVRCLVLAYVSTLLVSVAQSQTADEPSPRETALFDPTGYWVSIVSEDWRWRMLTPPKGDYTSIPLNAEGRRVADGWDPARQSSAERCRQYGAAGIMRIPGRLHIEWHDETTLRIDFDAGEQTRLLHFGDILTFAQQRSLQGESHARWHKQLQSRGLGIANRQPGGPGGTLVVDTGNLTAGLLRSNGVPYSENARLTEYFNRFSHRNGDSWLLVTSVVEDPVYLAEPFIVSTQFRREPDGSNWTPLPCGEPR